MTHCIYPCTSLDEYRAFYTKNELCLLETCPKLKKPPRSGFVEPPKYNERRCGYWRLQAPWMTVEEQKEFDKQERKKRRKQALSVICPECGHGMKSVQISRKEKQGKRNVQKWVRVGYLCFVCEMFKPSERFYKEQEIYGV